MKAAFTRTRRTIPIVLTVHQFKALSDKLGRDITAEVIALKDDWFEAKTLGSLMRYLEKVLKP